jgi:hypothetical protein
MQRGSRQDEQIKQLIVELRDFGWILPGIVVDQFEYLLPLLRRGPGLEHLREHVIESADCVKVTDTPPVAVDFRADYLFVLRLGIGQPFQKIAELVDAVDGPSYRRRQAMRLIVASDHCSPQRAPSARRDFRRRSWRTSRGWAACRCADAAPDSSSRRQRHRRGRI